MPACINLADTFGDRFRITHDESAVTWGDRRDPWMMQIPCERGTIFPHGGSLLAVEIDGRTLTAKRLADLPCCTVQQWGDAERTLLFHLADFETVAAVVKPRKRRVMTPEQREAAATRLAKHQFVSRTPDAPCDPQTAASGAT